MPSGRGRAIGATGELIAERQLARAGYRILERNYRTRHGELDIVAAGRGCLVFCEVKTRSAGSRGGPAGPLEGIGPRKRRQLRLMARQWLWERGRTGGPATRALRFDAIGVTLGAAGEPATVEHVEGAFG